MLEILALIALLAGLLTLIVLAIIDLKIGLLPNVYVLAFLLLGGLFHASTQLHYLNPLEIITGAAIGAGILYGIRFLAEKMYAPDSLGLGDVKLMGAAGVWLGPYYILIALTVGALAGLVHGLGLAAYLRIKTKQPVNLAGLSLPAGPGFVIGIIVAALYAFKDFPAMLLS